MKFDIITIFPDIFDSYLNESIIKRAQNKGLIKVGIHNLRDWTEDTHKSVDDKPFGGGLGMVMKTTPIASAVKSVQKKKKSKVILFSPRGKKFTQKKATEYAKLDQLIMISGRYEGIDERVAKCIADESISVGDYVLMGGELPAMTVIETVSRLIPGVIGKKEFLAERAKGSGFIEYPQYTRPEVFKGKDGKEHKVPKVLTSGNHKKIEEWKAKHGKVIGK